MVTCTCVRGSTLARLATVLVLLSIGNTPALRVTWQSCGKPSTKFPHGGLVECLCIPGLLDIFPGNSHIFEIDRSSETLQIWRWHCLVHILSHLSKSSIYSGQKIMCVFIKVIMQNEVNSIKFSISSSFCAGPSLPGLATVSV